MNAGVLIGSFVLVGGICYGEEVRSILSPVYTIDKMYRSMEGPQSQQAVVLLPDAPRELLWVTGFKTEMVGEDGKAPSKPEFMCHVNLDLNLNDHQSRFGPNLLTSRILTLSQGQLGAKFPAGFGVPVLSDEPLSMTTQVLNHNLKEVNMKVRHKVTFTFVRDKELKTPMQALFNRSPFVMTLLEGRSGVYGKDSAVSAESCLPGDHAPNSGGGSVYSDQFAQKFSGHWKVKPGREVRPTNVTPWLNLPYDTTVHYIAVHLHPFAESLELKDLTSGKTVFKSKARNPKTGIGLDDVQSFSSVKGLPLFKEHQYAMISTYNNTSDHDADSMAVMLMFLKDKTFKKPDAQALSLPPPPEILPIHRSTVAIVTDAGTLKVRFFPEEAPRTVVQFVDMIKAAVFDGNHFYRIEPGFVAQTAAAYDRIPPLSPLQSSFLKKIPLEPSSRLHKRGVLSLAREDADPNSGESSFSILLADAPHLDGKYTVFGEVISGWKVLDKIAATPRDAQNRPIRRLTIKKIELVR